MILLSSAHVGFPRTEEASWQLCLIFVYLCRHIFILFCGHLMYANSFSLLFLCILKKSLLRILFIIIMWVFKKKKNLVTNSCTIMRTHATIQTFKMKWKSFEFNLLSVFIITFDWFHSLSIRAVICKAAQCLSTWHNTWGNGPSLKKSSSVCNQSNQ